MGNRQLRRPVGQGAWAALAAVAVMVVLGALPHSASGAQKDAWLAANCSNFSGGLPSGWEPVEPLTAQSQKGQVLYEKRTPMARMSEASLYRGCFVSKMPVSGMSLPITAGGIAFVSFSPIENGKPSTRPESLSACFALIVP